MSCYSISAVSPCQKSNARRTFRTSLWTRCYRIWSIHTWSDTHSVIQLSQFSNSVLPFRYSKLLSPITFVLQFSHLHPIRTYYTHSVMQTSTHSVILTNSVNCQFSPPHPIPLNINLVTYVPFQFSKSTQYSQPTVTFVSIPQIYSIYQTTYRYNPSPKCNVLHPLSNLLYNAMLYQLFP